MTGNSGSLVQSGASLSGTVVPAAGESCPCEVTIHFANGFTMSGHTAPDGSFTLLIPTDVAGGATVTSNGVVVGSVSVAVSTDAQRFAAIQALDPDGQVDFSTFVDGDQRHAGIPTTLRLEEAMTLLPGLANVVDGFLITWDRDFLHNFEGNVEEDDGFRVVWTDGSVTPLDAPVGLAVRETLGPAQISAVRAATEPFVGAVAAYIGDPSNIDLSEVDENFLRAQLVKLHAEFSLIEGADSADVRRTIGKIVRRLLDLRQFGDQTRDLLTELGGEPPEAVEQIIDELAATLDRVANWADEPDLEHRDDEATIASIVAPAEAVPAIEAQLPTVVDPSKLQQALDDYRKGFASQLGKRSADTVVGLGALSMLLAERYGLDIDAILFQLGAHLDGLRDAFVHRKAPPEEPPAEL